MFLQRQCGCESWGEFPDALPMQTGSCVNHTYTGSWEGAKPSTFSRRGIIHSRVKKMGTKGKKKKKTSHFKDHTISRGWRGGRRLGSSSPSLESIESINQKLILQSNPEMLCQDIHCVSCERQHLLHGNTAVVAPQQNWSTQTR